MASEKEVKENGEDQKHWFKTPIFLSVVAIFTVTSGIAGLVSYISGIKQGIEDEVAQRTTDAINASSVAEQAAEGAAAYQRIQEDSWKWDEGYIFRSCWSTVAGCKKELGLPSELPTDRTQNSEIKELKLESEINAKFRRETCQNRRDEAIAAGQEPKEDCTKY